MNCIKQQLKANYRTAAKFSFWAGISDSACPLLNTETGCKSLKPPTSTTGHQQWPLFKQIRLVQNMRTVLGSQEFADWLIKLGNGILPKTPRLNNPELIKIPPDFLYMDTNMIEHDFGHPTQLLDDGVADQIYNRAILCPKK
jgi:hypothetical protein